jgi:acetate kinase
MATRSGSVDPGMLLWLLEREAVDERELAAALEHESGLAGLAGSADLRVVLERRAAGDEEAGLAVEVYIHRLRAEIAAMAAALGGLDALVFTGGVGENAAEIRSLAAAGLGFLGVSLDERANRDGEADRELTGADAAVRSAVLRAREDLEMTRQAEQLLTR